MKLNPKTYCDYLYVEAAIECDRIYNDQDDDRSVAQILDNVSERYGVLEDLLRTSWRELLSKKMNDLELNVFDIYRIVCDNHLTRSIEEETE